MHVNIARWVPLSIIIPNIITALLKLVLSFRKQLILLNREFWRKKNATFWKQAKVIWMLPKIFDWVMCFGITCCDFLAEHCLLFKWNFSQLIRWSVAGIENICPAKYHKSENLQAGWIMKQKSFQRTAWQLVEKFPEYYITQNETVLLTKNKQTEKHFWRKLSKYFDNVICKELFGRAKLLDGWCFFKEDTIVYPDTSLHS